MMQVQKRMNPCNAGEQRMLDSQEMNGTVTKSVYLLRNTPVPTYTQAYKLQHHTGTVSIKQRVIFLFNEEQCPTLRQKVQYFTKLMSLFISAIYHLTSIFQFLDTYILISMSSLSFRHALTPSCLDIRTWLSSQVFSKGVFSTESVQVLLLKITYEGKLEA